MAESATLYIKDIYRYIKDIYKDKENLMECPGTSAKIKCMLELNQN